MFEKSIPIDKKTYDEANKILDEIGLSVTDIVKITLKKIIREGNISFLIEKKSNETTISSTPAPLFADKMTKSKAVSLFRNEGLSFNSIVTFASKNKSTRNYWANPSFDLLNENWNLILNDNINKKLHLFYIPKNSITPSQFVCRADNSNVIDLQILGDDVFFTDTRSKFSFSKYLKKTISY